MQHWHLPYVSPQNGMHLQKKAKRDKCCNSGHMSAAHLDHCICTELSTGSPRKKWEVTTCFGKLAGSPSGWVCKYFSSAARSCRAETWWALLLELVSELLASAVLLLFAFLLLCSIERGEPVGAVPTSDLTCLDVDDSR